MRLLVEVYQLFKGPEIDVLINVELRILVLLDAIVAHFVVVPVEVKKKCRCGIKYLKLSCLIQTYNTDKENLLSPEVESLTRKLPSFPCNYVGENTQTCEKVYTNQAHRQSGFERVCSNLPFGLQKILHTTLAIHFKCTTVCKWSTSLTAIENHRCQNEFG